MDEKKQETKETPKTIDKLCEQIDKKLEELVKQGVQQTNVDYIGKLIDLKKDIAKIEKMEGEDNMYRDYDNYGRDSYGTYDRMYAGGRSRDSRGRFMEDGRGSYGRRYRGHDMIDDMSENYGTYMEGNASGRYGNPETTKSLQYMLQSAEDFFKHLKGEATSQEEVEMIKKSARRISEM